MKPSRLASSRTLRRCRFGAMLWTIVSAFGPPLGRLEVARKTRSGDCSRSHGPSGRSLVRGACCNSGRNHPEFGRNRPLLIEHVAMLSTYVRVGRSPRPKSVETRSDVLEPARLRQKPHQPLLSARWRRMCEVGGRLCGPSSTICARAAPRTRWMLQEARELEN